MNRYENYLWKVQLYLMEHYGVDTGNREIYPLLWYVNTARASVEWLKLLMTKKPYMIARQLHKGGTDEEIIARITDYIGFRKIA